MLLGNMIQKYVMKHAKKWFLIYLKLSENISAHLSLKKLAFFYADSCSLAVDVKLKRPGHFLLS